MPKIRVAAANLAWMASCYPAYRSFRRALLDPQKAQEKILKGIVRRNCETEFGRLHDFSAISNVRDFQKRVQACIYDDLDPLIARVRAGEKNVLTSEPVHLFERTSGSSSAAKYIPYTDSLRHEFQRAVRAWIFDLYRHDPKLLLGRSYWLITPLSREKEITPGGIPVGFENDADYLGNLERKIAEILFAVPGDLAQVPDIESSLYLTLRFLLQADDLTLISVWNPSYLSILMARLGEWASRLLDDLRNGTVNPPHSPNLPLSLTRRLRAQPERARIFQQILKDNGQLGSQDLWPHLRLISCWTSGAAIQSREEIARLFPRVHLQGKGLLATEGVATIPWTEAGGSLPALNSHFYEFVADNGDAKLTHELEAHAEYSILLTTGGGLYRYRLGDRVRVSHLHGGVPALEFIGRDDGVSDLRGEKLSQAFVQACLNTVLADAGLLVRFAMLAPQNEAVPSYVLYIESSSNLEQVGPALEHRLRANPHYDYCRSLGQLGPLKIYKIVRLAQETYVSRCAELGQRVGSIKPTSLHRSGGWEDFFIGAFVSEPRKEFAPC